MKQPRQLGFSLIEVMIVTAIISISALAIATMFAEQMKASRGVQASAEAIYLQGDIRELIASLDNCSLNFGPDSGTPLNPNTETTITVLKRKVGATTVEAFKLAPQRYGNDTLEIEKITFGPADPPHTGPNPSTSSFITPLRIVMSKTGSVIGPKQLREKVISVHTRTDASGRVIACSSATLGAFVQEQLDDNGLVEFPNGLIIQWGRASAMPNARTNISYPKQFPNRAFSVTVSGTGDVGANSKDNWPTVYGFPGRGGFSVTSANDQPDPISWIAIGN